MGQLNLKSNWHWNFSIFTVFLFLGLNLTFAYSNSNSNYATKIKLENSYDELSFQGFFRSGELLNQDELANSFFDGVSETCREHSLLWLKELTTWSRKSQVPITYESTSNQEIGKGTRLKFPTTWAIQMLDAWAKFPEGLLSGHTQAFGDFPECLQVRAKDGNDTAIFKGQYCLTTLMPTDKLNLSLSAIDSEFNTRESVSIEEFFALLLSPGFFNMLPLIGTCFPSTCSTEDASMLLNNFYNIVLGGVLEQQVIACTTDDKPPFDAGDISMIVILALIATLCVLGTALDVLVYQKTSPESQKKMSNGFRAILAFSWHTNVRKWANTSSGSGDLGCLHGLRFLSICWVVWAHSFETFNAVWNGVDANKIYKQWYMYIILNGSVSVDTFFVLSGLLVAYTMLRYLESTRGKMNIPLLYFHRYCRLTPMYMLVVGLTATLFRYMGTGPFSYQKEESAQKCREHWWKNLLYVSNLINTGEWGEFICMAESWYISNDMQFYILSPFIVFALWKSKIIGGLVIAVLMAVTTATPTIIAAIKEYPAGDTPFDLYFRPWCRMTPYLIGMVLGYIFYRQKSAHNPLKIGKLPKWAVALFWLLSTCFAITVLFVNRPFWDPEFQSNSTEKALGYIYLGYHRTVWALSISWIIFACINGYGGWVNSFLSWSAFIPLGRITFAIYIISINLQTTLYRSFYTPIAFNMYLVVNFFFAHLVMSCLVGFILTMAVEAPFLQLEKIFLPERRKKKEPIT